MSHSNGFPLPPAKFKLIHGRDYPIMKQLQNVLEKRGNARNIHLLDQVYDAWQSKAILGCFDMVISGRVHAAVGALSQYVPTVIIDYGHEPKAHKLRGFALAAKQLDNLADPEKTDDLYNKMVFAWSNREKISQSLNKQIPIVKQQGKEHFVLLKDLFNG